MNHSKINQNKQNTVILYIIACEPSGDILGAELLDAITSQIDLNNLPIHHNNPILSQSSSELKLDLHIIGQENLQKIYYSFLNTKKQKNQHHNSERPKNNTHTHNFTTKNNYKIQINQLTFQNSKILSIIGFTEILTSILKILGFMNSLVSDIIEKKPHAIITIDAPGFNLRLMNKLYKKLKKKKTKIHQNTQKITNKNTKEDQKIIAKEEIKNQFDYENIKKIHYVAPTVWAYNSNRVNTIAKLYNSILLLFPFEKRYFAHHLHCEVVGHPLVEKITQFLKEEEQIKRNTAISNNTTSKQYKPQKQEQKQEQKQNKKPEIIQITILPGSRINEIRNHMPIIIKMMYKIAKFYHFDNKKYNINNKIRFYFPTNSHTQALVKMFCSKILSQINALNPSIISIDISSDIQKIKWRKMLQSNIVISKSGTSLLEIALLTLPVISFYKLSKITAFILKLKLKINSFALPNIISGKKIIREFIQNEFTAENLFSYVIFMLNNPEIKQRQLNEFQKMKYKIHNKNKHNPQKRSEQNHKKNKEYDSIGNLEKHITHTYLHPHSHNLQILQKKIQPTNKQYSFSTNPLSLESMQHHRNQTVESSAILAAKSVLNRILNS